MALQPDEGQLDTTGLTTSDFTMVFVDATTGTPRNGDGVFTDLTAASSSAPAMITYQPSANDVATIGLFSRRVVIKKSTIHQRTFDFGNWVCQK